MGSLIGVKSMLHKINFLVVLILFLAAMLASAHDGHKPDTVTVVDGDTIAINGIPVTDTLYSSKELTELDKTVKVKAYELIVGDALGEHIHNKIIHYPIALALVGFILAVLGYKEDRFQLAVKIMILIAGVFAIIAFFSGTNQFEPFINDPKEWLAETHRLLGIASAIFIWLLYLVLIIKPMKKFRLIFAVITVILVSLTGLYGGVLAH
jgi:uncharacterized membrane protein